MTPAEAQALQDRAQARGRRLMWFVSRERSGRFVARAHAADPGRAWLPGELAADTLDTLRAILPRGLTRRDRTSVMPADVIETWD